MKLHKEKWLSVLFVVGMLHGCGGSDSGADVTANPPPLSTGGSVNYTGPVGQTSDVNAFKQYLWDRVARADRCGACHVQSQQAPSFARNDDINLAYSAANTVVTLSSPASSRMVTKVGEGHQCWEATTSACTTLLTAWITEWANASLGGEAEQVAFEPPPIRDPGSTLYFPESSGDFATTVYPLLTNFCSDCHKPGVATPITPYFAHDDVDTAYLAAQSVINLNTPGNSRLVTRLAQDRHNCWSDSCDADASAMTNAIANFAAGLTPVTPPESLVISKALTLPDGTLAASGGRHETNVIARYEFRTGEGAIAYDTAPTEPAADLNLIDDVEWVGGWGIRINNGKAQSSTSSSAKLNQMIQASGEFSIEAWVIPATAAQNNAHIFSYSAGTTARNVTLAQAGSSYRFALRHNNTDLNGGIMNMPFDSPAESLQASLQHVALTYDPINGRRIYVNGENTGVVDPVVPALLNSWNDSYALVLGNEASSDRPWQGVIRFVAVHNRALDATQIAQNFNAGVGERRYLLFGISHLVDEDDAYIGFEVSRFDNYAYLFATPFFIDLTEGQTSAPAQFAVSGMRLGINGAEAQVGQAWTHLDTTAGGAGYSAGGQPLSPLGTLVAVDQGEQQDEFFLTFARLGDHSNVYVEPVPTPFQLGFGDPQSLVGVRTFDAINLSMSELTGVPPTYTANTGGPDEIDVATTFESIRKQLPTSPELGGFLTSHQIAVAQLSIEYCNALVEANIAGDSDVPVFFTGLDYNTNANSITDADWRNLVITPLVNRFVGTGLAQQPDLNAVTCELESLLLDDTSGSTACSAAPTERPAPASLARCAGSCSADRTAIATKAACAAALGSATLLMQ